MIFTLDPSPEPAVSLVERTVAESAQRARARKEQERAAPAVYAGAPRRPEEAALGEPVSTGCLCFPSTGCLRRCASC